MSIIHDAASHNRLLSGLPIDILNQLLENCNLVRLDMGARMGKPGDIVYNAYFPVDCLISLMVAGKKLQQETEKSLEIGLIGNEGMLGIQLMLGEDVSPYNILVQASGTSLYISAPLLIAEVAKSEVLKQHLNSYIHVLMTQLAQMAFCNRFHMVNERLASLLLMMHDRLHATSFFITQDLLANMLGVRRVGVTKSACLLQMKNLVHYSRGHIEILDLAGLQAAACSCYLIDKNTYDSILDNPSSLDSAPSKL